MPDEDATGPDYDPPNARRFGGKFLTVSQRERLIRLHGPLVPAPDIDLGPLLQPYRLRNGEMLVLWPEDPEYALYWPSLEALEQYNDGFAKALANYTGQPSTMTHGIFQTTSEAVAAVEGCGISLAARCNLKRAPHFDSQGLKAVSICSERLLPDVHIPEDPIIGDLGLFLGEMIRRRSNGAWAIDDTGRAVVTLPDENYIDPWSYLLDCIDSGTDSIGVMVSRFFAET